MSLRIRLQGCSYGQSWESEQLLRIGRLDGIEVQATDPSVSRYHAEARHEYGRWWLRDLGSANGTFVNGERLGVGRRRIDHGDEVRFGNVAFKVRLVVVGSEAWDACAHPLSMLESLPNVPWTAPPYDRKLRLWAVDCVRRHGGPGLDSSRDFIRQALGRVEVLTDLDPEGFERGRLALLEEMRAWQSGVSNRANPLSGSLEALLCPRDERLSSSMYAAALADPWRSPLRPDEGSNAKNAGVLRCVLGDPWRQPSVDPSWLVFDGGAIAALAHAIVRGVAFEDMPVLADALEDAGCSDGRLLGHLRGGGAHCRGCHALDAVLGRHLAVAPPSIS